MSYGLYAARVFGVSFLKLSRSLQHELQLYCCARCLLSGRNPCLRVSAAAASIVEPELQALTDTAAGFLIGSRDGGNGLKSWRAHLTAERG